MISYLLGMIVKVQKYDDFLMIWTRPYSSMQIRQNHSRTILIYKSDQSTV
jgi:hypothetical protein